jgi:signal transduction histidine kinase
VKLPPFFYSIRFRLALWFSLVLALVLAAFSVFVYVRELQAVRSEAALRLSARMRQFDETVLRPLRYAHDDDAPKVTTASFPLLEKEAALVANPQGQVIESGGGLTDEEAGRVAGLGLAALDSGPSGMERERFFACQLTPAGEEHGEDYVFAVLPLPAAEGQAGDLFILGRPMDPDERMASLLATLLLGAAATLLIAAGGGVWLAGRALRPVRAITRTAQSISENDLNQRLNLKTRDELGDLARTFDGMLDRLQAAFDRQRRFTADASHELRTPLSILTLESERTLTGKRSPEEYRHALEIVRSETGFMAQLVEEMLTLARMDSGQARLKREALDLSEVALDAIERFLPMAERKATLLRAGELPELHLSGDRAALGQMVGNLIENALKYAAGPGQWVRVETGSGLEAGAPYAWLRVSDSGPGIPAAALPHLFERFYRADETRSRNPDEGGEIPGSGLGLSIVQRIAELHGGGVRVWNQDGGGAVFEVRLPLT